jgi:UDP-N-acetylmuramate--alanine ligase
MKHIHFVGIKGVAMTALAIFAKEKGYTVSGSDIAEEFPTDSVLKKAGIKVIHGFSPQNVQGDMVIYTGAHGGRENIEVIKAQKNGIPCFAHGKALGNMMQDSRQISVAGCHGKTTTSAMIATIFVHAGMDPSYAIGAGEIRGLGLPAHAGSKEWFIAEADEYATDPGHDNTPRFLWQNPEILLVTSIDYDHPDVYPDIDAVGNAYAVLANKAKHVVINGDDKNSRIYLRFIQPDCTYGQTNSDLVIEQKEQKPFENHAVFHIGEDHIPVMLQVPGMHNLFNAAGAFLVAKLAGIDSHIIIDGLKRFGGASRRFEYIGEKDGAVIIDDYAHHPAEILSTLQAARSWYPKKRIIALFQPHTYSRTRALLAEFGRALGGFDEVGILPIYPSARETEKSIDAEDVVKEIQQHNPRVKLYFLVESFFEHTFSGDDIILSLGAGDIGRKVKELVKGR